MFGTGFAFGITEDDIFTVLCNNRARIVDVSKKDLEAYAEELMDGFDVQELDRIEKAALDSGTEMDAQTDGAHAEICAILVEQGVLKAEA